MIIYGFLQVVGVTVFHFKISVSDYSPTTNQGTSGEGRMLRIINPSLQPGEPISTGGEVGHQLPVEQINKACVSPGHPAHSSQRQGIKQTASLTASANSPPGT